MIIRLTEKLGKKIGIKPISTVVLHDNHFADWTGHLFCANRVQYIIVSNTDTLYSLLIRGKGINNCDLLIANVCAIMEEVMKTDGLQDGYENHVKPYLREVTFAKTLNRSVTGSMNDLIYQSKISLECFDLPMCKIISSGLNDTLLPYLNYVNPGTKMKQLLEKY